VAATPLARSRALAQALNVVGVVARADCHCAPLAHHALGIEASWRFSFYLYNTLDEADRPVHALADIVSFGSGASSRPLHSKVPE
jgi:cysteine desulfurase/selenocysteine lyase